MHSTFSRARHSRTIFAPLLRLAGMLFSFLLNKKATVEGLFPPPVAKNFSVSRSDQAGPVITPTPIIRIRPTRSAVETLMLRRLAWLGSVIVINVSRKTEYRRRLVNAIGICYEFYLCQHCDSAGPRNY